MNTEPLISIIIPTYNREFLIRETLDSVLSQTYTHWECIVVDDGSTDKTKEVVQEYIEKDKRFVLFDRPSNRIKGANACRNYGFEMSKGDYINWFDSDDIMLQNFISTKLKILLKNEKVYNCVCSYGAYFLTDKTDYEVKKPYFKSNTLLDYVNDKYFFTTHGPLWKRSFLENKQLFDEKRQKLQDTEFHFRMLLKGMQFKFYQKKHLFLIRRGENRISSKSNINLEKIEQVFLYHFFTLTKKDYVDIEKSKYVYITSIKTLRGFYELMNFNPNLIKRLKLYFKYFKTVIFSINHLSNNCFKRIWINFVILIIVITKRGFKLIK